MLARQRGFAAVAMLTTALVIGVTATLFSVFDAVLLRPLRWPRADRLVRFTETHAGATRQMPLSMTSTAWLAMRSMTVTIAGVSAGLIAAYVAARYLATLLYGVSVHDTFSFVAVPVTLAAIALAACTAPGLRAMRIDPVKQLRG